MLPPLSQAISRSIHHKVKDVSFFQSHRRLPEKTVSIDLIHIERI